MLTRLQFAKRAHKCNREYPFWQEGSQAEMIVAEPVMREKRDYLHMNPLKRGDVDLKKHGRYSKLHSQAGSWE